MGKNHRMDHDHAQFIHDIWYVYFCVLFASPEFWDTPTQIIQNTTEYF
jgi:hypothetical protein